MLLQSSLELVTWLLPLYKIQNVLMFTTLHWVLLASLFVPILTLLGIVWILRGIRSLQRERAPVSEKLLRPAGESLRRELEKLDEQVNDIFIWTFFGPALITAIIVILNAGVKPAGGSAVAVIIIITAVSTAFVFLVWRLINLINRRRDYRLGFAGERAVAEELNQLMLGGCRVFSRCANGTLWKHRSRARRANRHLRCGNQSAP